MSIDRPIELVVTVEVNKANQSIKSVNANLSGIEETAVRTTRSASQGIGGMAAAIVKGATAGNLLANAIKRALSFAKEWTIEAAKEAAHTERAAALARSLARAHGDGAAAAEKVIEASRDLGFAASDATTSVQKLIMADIGLAALDRYGRGGVTSRDRTMTLPTTFLSALLVAVLGLVCLGSWINTLKLCKKWRFELYYFDFALGAFVAAAVAAITLGALGADGFTFTDDLMRAGKRNIVYAIAGGMIFNLGNLLLVGATALIGMSLAFPMACGTGLLVSALFAYFSGRPASAGMFFTALGLAALAITFGVLSHRSLALAKEVAKMKAGEHRTLRPSVAWRGVIVGLVSGVLLGVYYPLAAAAKAGEAGVGPYALAVAFNLGVLTSTVVYNLYLMNLPLQGRPIEIPEYFRGRFRSHWLGWLGGVTWAAGMLACWVLGAALQETLPPSGIIFAMLQSAPLLAVLWGVLAWREFKPGDARARAYLVMVVFLFGACVAMLALIPFSTLP
ncbi:MAG: hypothetical protein IT159_12645 [Bryobacterales bacterium]|nr:hypothetical protein [Bryobacterales bacterium]